MQLNNYYYYTDCTFKRKHDCFDDMIFISRTTLLAHSISQMLTCSIICHCAHEIRVDSFLKDLPAGKRCILLLTMLQECDDINLFASEITRRKESHKCNFKARSL